MLFMGYSQAIVSVGEQLLPAAAFDAAAGVILVESDAFHYDPFIG
jgi:hypothetical protein